MYDYLRCACAVPDVTVGNPDANVDAMLALADRCEAQSRPDIIVFPELCITGYTCGDLFFQRPLQIAACRGLERCAETWRERSFAALVGLPLTVDGQLYNCGVLLYHGRIAGIVPKTMIPTYNEFYEKRWFESAVQLTRRTVDAVDLGLSGMSDTDIPIGNDLIFTLGDVRLGVEICEDLWAPVSPGNLLALAGAEVLCNLSASNETISKRRYRRDLVSQQSARCLCAYVYCSAGGKESTTDLIFSGHTVIAENGTVLSENEETIASDYLSVSDIDVGKLRADRCKIKTFAQSAALYGRPVRTVRIDNADNLPTSDGTLYPVSRTPFVPHGEKDRRERCRSIFQMQVAGLKKRLEVTRCKPVVGVSGGLDSTLALLVSAEAVRQLGLPASETVGITMPCFGTTGRTFRNSVKLMEALGLTTETIRIADAVNTHFSDIGQDPEKHDLTYENAQARERTQVLMDYAGRVGGLVVGTGDLSELALGWCTYNADHMSMYGVNASIPKTLIRWMIDSIMECGLFPAASEILTDVLDTPISPELLPPSADGTIAQCTEELVGPYLLHDFFLYYVLRFGFEPAKIYRLACRAFDREFEPETIKKWLVAFYRRFFSQQFKRSCMPDGVKVGSVCLSPRGDWRMPSDASGAVWIAQAESL